MRPQLKELTRAEKERLLEAKREELQEIWRTPPSPPPDTAGLSDELLDELLAETRRKIRVEKLVRAFIFGTSAAALLVGVLGVLSLLVFGIKQLFFRH
jgi:hypothetical protein